MTPMHDRLQDLLEAGEVDGLHAAVAVHRGRTVLEYHGSGEDFAWGRPLGKVDFAPETLHDIRSVTKSVTALLYGIALGEGLVASPAEPLLPSFPQYPDLAADPERAGLTVEHALTMSLGLEWREDLPYTTPENAEVAMELAPDRYRYVLERPVVEPPGVRWSYCGGASVLIGGLIERGTGMPLQEYGQKMLFEPLGIESFEWMAGRDGVVSPASGLRLASRDLAKIGELVLADGLWDGRQVVSAEWVSRMLEPRLSTGGGQYGYGWYIESAQGHRMVAGMGNGGQRLYVVPDLELVVAVAAGNYDAPEQWRTPNTVLERAVLPEMA